MLEQEARLHHAREVFFESAIKPIVQNPLVADAFQSVDRRNFIPPGTDDLAYTDRIIQMEAGSSMSQPTLVAVMLDFLDLTGSEKTLEVGTASGYNAALLAHCSREVHTIEYNETLAKKAKEKLQKLGYTNIYTYAGDGAQGIPEQAPFDRIILTASVREFPQLLFDQLKDGGIMVGPVGETKDTVKLAIGEKDVNILHLQRSETVYFVPLISTEHGGWTEEAQTKKRDYQIDESDVPIAYPQIPEVDMDDIIYEVENLEPTPECLEVLSKYGLTQNQFVNMFEEMGQAPHKTKRLLSFNPEILDGLVQMAIFAYKSKNESLPKE